MKPQTLTINTFTDYTGTGDGLVVIQQCVSDGATPAWQLAVDRKFIGDLVQELMKAMDDFDAQEVAA